jgi:Asp-tRNA(Asn)/Glu-tRNA(Gln) amidotransferase A subunit family amidase
MPHDLTGSNSGSALAASLATGTVRLADVLAAYLDVIDTREPVVRGFVHLNRGAFLDPRSPAGPLAGLPVGVKDIIDVTGMPTECGSPIYKDHMPPGDAPVVSMIRRAGGRIAGKTVTTEFATRHPGPTTNPRNPAHTPGGSSSGSAAGVAAGMFPFAVGTQTAGSVIRPGAYCGIAALKPTFGFLPYAGVKATAWHLDTVGLYGRTVRDVAFFAEAITEQSLAVVATSDWKPRLGVMPMQTWDECSEDMKNAIDSAAHQAEKYGATVRHLHADAIFETAYAAQLIIQDYEIARSLAFEFDRFEHLFSPVLHETMRTGQAIAGNRYAQALEDQRAARRASIGLFADIDALLAPSAPGAAPQGLASTGSPNLNRLFTQLGTPCVNVPGLADTAGMPLGVQIIAPIGADELALRAAAWLEDVLNR